MKIHHIIFLAACCMFVVYLLYRELAHYRFHRNMKIGDRCSFYINEERTPGVIRHIDDETGMIVILDIEMKGHVVSRSDVYPSFHPLFYLI